MPARPARRGCTLLIVARPVPSHRSRFELVRLRVRSHPSPRLENKNGIFGTGVGIREVSPDGRWWSCGTSCSVACSVCSSKVRLERSVYSGQWCCLRRVWSSVLRRGSSLFACVCVRRLCYWRAYENVGRLFRLTIPPSLQMFLSACSFELVGARPCVFQALCSGCVSCLCLFDLAPAVRSNHTDIVTL